MFISVLFSILSRVLQISLRSPPPSFVFHVSKGKGEVLGNLNHWGCLESYLGGGSELSSLRGV